MNIKGEFATRRVWVDGKEMDPGEGRKIHDHSPDGFNWGYGGSGPAQLALTLVIETAKFIPRGDGHLPIMKAVPYYQDFKWEYVAQWPQSDFEVDIDAVGWLLRKIDKEAA